MLGILLSLLPLSPASPQQTTGSAWVVQEVIAPAVRGQHQEFAWRSAHPLGDPDGDGIPLLGFRGYKDYGPVSSGLRLDHTRFTDGLRAGVERLWERAAWQGNFRIGDTFSTEAAALASPLGTLLVIAAGPYSAGLELRELASGAQVQFLAGPSTREIRPAGDLDGDGWEDFFQVDEGFQVVAWSTASMTPLWTQPLAGALLIYDIDLPTQASLPPDLDGDGVADVTVALCEWGGDTSVRALSGADGSLLWSSTPFYAGFAHPLLAGGADVTGDGVADFVVAAEQELRAVDGAAGTTLWASDLQPLLPWLDPGTFYVGPASAPALVRRPEAPDELDYVLPAYSLHDFIGQTNVVRSVFHLDASDGTVRSRDELPVDLQPWGPDPLRGSTGQLMLLGDVDRDGLPEYADALPVDVAVVGSGREFSAFAILGRRTLDAPAELAPGATGALRIMLPGAALRPWVLAVSDTVDPLGGGFQPDGWRTHLAPTPLFAAVLQQRPWHGTLDAQGQAAFALTLPQAPALIGTRLHFKALVPDGASGLWTASTPAVTEVVP